MVRGDPRLGETADGQEVAEVAGVGAVGLGSALRSPQGPGVGRLCEVGLDPGPAEFLDHEQPPGGGLEGEGHVLSAFEPPEPGADILPGGRADLALVGLAALGVEVVVRDLSAMHVQTAYDRHGDLLSLRRSTAWR